MSHSSMSLLHKHALHKHTAVQEISGMENTLLLITKDDVGTTIHKKEEE